MTDHAEIDKAFREFSQEMVDQFKPSKDDIFFLIKFCQVLDLKSYVANPPQEKLSIKDIETSGVDPINIGAGAGIYVGNRLVENEVGDFNISNFFNGIRSVYESSQKGMTKPHINYALQGKIRKLSDELKNNIFSARETLDDFFEKFEVNPKEWERHKDAMTTLVHKGDPAQEVTFKYDDTRSLYSALMIDRLHNDFVAGLEKS